METAVNLTAAAEALTEHWSPRVVGRVNDQYVKVARLKGRLAWHAHEMEDELFLVLAGVLVLEFEDRAAVTLQAGEMYVVPQGVRHNPIAEEECLVALVETVTTLHTGDVRTPLTRSIAEQLGAKPAPHAEVGPDSAGLSEPCRAVPRHCGSTS